MLKYLYGKLPVASKLNGGREERIRLKGAGNKIYAVVEENGFLMHD